MSRFEAAVTGYLFSQGKLETQPRGGASFAAQQEFQRTAFAPGRQRGVGFGTHLPFHLILERCGLAWRDFLSSLRGFGDSVIVPHLSADFIAEVHVGVVEVEVVPIQVGTTSFTLRCTMLQEQQQVARVDVVLVSFDYEGGSKTPLTEGQRAQLLDLKA